MGWQDLVFVVLLWSLIGLRNHPHSVLTHILRTALLRFPARCCSNSRPLHLWIVRIMQYLSSWNTVRFQQHSGIMHPYKIFSICLVVITFQFVLGIFVIENLCEDDHHYSKACLSWSRLARMLSWKGFIFFTHFWDCSVKTELIYRSNGANNSCNRVLVGSLELREGPMKIGWRLDWLHFLSRDARRCNRQCLHSSMIGIICTAS